MWFSLLYSGYEIKATVSQLEKDIGRISKECRKPDITPETAKNLCLGLPRTLSSLLTLSDTRALVCFQGISNAILG